MKKDDSSSKDQDIADKFFPFFIVYRDGRVERFNPTEFVPPSLHSPAAVSSKDVSISSSPSVSVRLFLPTNPPPSSKLPVILYIHGGAFCIESAMSPLYHSHLLSLSSHAQALCVSVEYRLAPENPLPAAYDDVWAAFRWTVSCADPWLAARADLGRVFVMGDSAGANLAHSVAVRAGVESGVRLEGLAAVHPFFWVRDVTGDKKWMNERNHRLWRYLCPSSTRGILGEPCMNPAAEEAPSLVGLGCKKVLVCLAGADFLLEQGEGYLEALKKKGYTGPVEVVLSEGEDHVFHLFNPDSKSSKELMDRFVAFVHQTN